MADVLIVEDDSGVANVLAEILKTEGHEVRVACDGEQGLRLLHERIPDLVLLDIEMPILNGPGMAARMLQDAGLAKVPIALTSASPKIRAVATEVGTPYFLGKPYTYGRLMGLLERTLHERTPPNPRRTELPLGGRRQDRCSSRVG